MVAPEGKAEDPQGDSSSGLSSVPEGNFMSDPSNGFLSESWQNFTVWEFMRILNQKHVTGQERLRNSVIRPAAKSEYPQTLDYVSGAMLIQLYSQTETLGSRMKRCCLSSRWTKGTCWWKPDWTQCRFSATHISLASLASCLPLSCCENSCPSSADQSTVTAS